MAFRSALHTFTKATTTGVQTVTGVGFAGKALLLWTTWQTATGATTGAAISLGMTDGVLQSVRAITHPGGETATTSAQAEHVDAIAWRMSATSGATPTTQVAGVFTGFTADGFTIDWTTNDGTAAIVHALVLGGSLEAVFTPVKVTVAAGGTLAVTGVGFQPEAFVVMGGAANQFVSGSYSLGAPFGSFHGFGFSNASAQVCGWTLGLGTGGAADTYRGQHTDRVASVRAANVSGAGELMGARITAVGADGFTLTRDVGTLTNQPTQHILCLRGVRFALGSFTTPLTAGNTSLALGFEPDVLLLQTHGTTASSNTSGMSFALGAWQRVTGATGGCWIGGVDAASPSVYRRSLSATTVLEARDASSGSVTIAATVSASDDAGATLAFSTVRGSADAVIYLAMAGASSITGSLVAGVKTTVAATRAISFGLDDLTHRDTRVGTFTVHGDTWFDGDVEIEGDTLQHGNLEVEGDTVLDGDVTVLGTLTAPGVPGAPTDAAYVTLSADSDLTAERVLTAGTGITITDGGPGSTVTIAATGTTHHYDCPLSDGDLTAAEIIFARGECVIVQVPV
jgi:hypothetical protein